MADHPLRPATDRRLGGPLPRQLANPASAHPIAQGPKIPCFHPKVVCGISASFPALSPTTGQIPMHSSPVRHSPSRCIATPHAAVRLACVRHAASVQSEPGSNSSLEVFDQPHRLTCLSRSVEPNQKRRLESTHGWTLCISCTVMPSTARRPHKSPVHTVKEPDPLKGPMPRDLSSRASRPFYIPFPVRQHLDCAKHPPQESPAAGRLRATGRKS